MTWKLLQLAFPVVFVGIAFCTYRKNRSVLAGFREQLAVSPSGRRFVILAAMLVLIVYHFVALCGTANPIHLLPSSILVLVMLSKRYGEGIIRFFQKRKLQMAFLVAMLGAFFLPGTTPMAVTMMILLVTSWLYPTRQLMKKVSVHGDAADFVEEVIESIYEEMDRRNPCICSNDKDILELASDVDTEATHEEVLPEADVDDDMVGDSSVPNHPSVKAIHNQWMREKEREHRHNRAKRRARRAKHGH